MKCPYMTKTILDPIGTTSGIALLSDRVNDFYTDDDDPLKFPHTNFDPEKKIELYNFYDTDNVLKRNVYIQYHDCLREQCQVWDTTNERCGTLVSNTIINDPLDENHSMIQMMETILGKFSEKMAANNQRSILEFISHVHDSHRHPDRHECHDIPADCGGMVGGGNLISELSYAPTLVLEYITNQDLDGNNKIYGHYFKIRNSQEKPQILNDIEKQLHWIEPNIQVEWSAMLAWSRDPGNVPDPVPDP